MQLIKFKVTVDDIGKEFYPVDNSYAQDLSNGRHVVANNGFGLAGAGAFQHPPVKVKILSEPMMFASHNMFSASPSRNEMVIVEYKGTKFLVLNLFQKELNYPKSTFV